MKTRDEQAEEYVKALKEEFGYPELVDVYKAFQVGWDAALKSQWKDARLEKPEDSRFVLTIDLNKVVRLAYWNKKSRHWVDDMEMPYYCNPDFFTHWMPIPDLP